VDMRENNIYFLRYLKVIVSKIGKKVYENL